VTLRRREMAPVLTFVINLLSIYLTYLMHGIELLDVPECFILYVN